MDEQNNLNTSRGLIQTSLIVQQNDPEALGSSKDLVRFNTPDKSNKE